MKKTVKKIRFKVLKDGWVKDLTTGLEIGPSAKVSMNFKSAVDYCVHKGGRLPTRQELEFIQDLTKNNPCIDKKIFKDTLSGYYWSSTPCVWNKSCYWCVSFDYGYVFSYNEFNYGYVRPVRASQ